MQASLDCPWAPAALWSCSYLLTPRPCATVQAQLGRRREQQATKRFAVAETAPQAAPETGPADEAAPAGEAAGSKEEDSLKDAALAAEVLAGLAGSIKAASGAEEDR